MKISTSITRLLRPKSICVVGASASRQALANTVLENLRLGEFDGAVHVVHPKAEFVEGIAALPKLADLPRGVDCVVLAIRPDHVVEAVRACADRDVGGVIIFSAGFAELGERGAAEQDEISRIAAEAGMAVEGPNCLGYVNFVDRIAPTFSVPDFLPVTGPAIGIASQSGAMAVVLRGAFHGRGREVSYAISSGNEAVTGLEDFIEYLVEDEHTHVITVMAEHFRDAQRFLGLVERADQANKPIVLLHPGTSVAAREAAKTHTGALAGDNKLMRAVVKSRGVYLVDTLEELIDVAEFLHLFGPMKGLGVGIITESGALCAQMLDYCGELNVKLPAPTGVVEAELSAVAPGLIRASNPLDLTAQAMMDPDIYRKALDGLAQIPEIGCLVIAISLTSGRMADRKLPPLLKILDTRQLPVPVVFAMIGDDARIAEAHIDRIRQLGMPFYRSPERVVRCLAQLAAEKPARVGRALAPRSNHAFPPGITTEVLAKSELKKIGFPVPSFELATSAEEAVAAAEWLGYPVALKVQSQDIPHKTELGGVALDLQNPGDVASTYTNMMRVIAEQAPKARIGGILVERMAEKGIELIVGGRNDADWGGAIMIGMGGTLAEVMKDVALLPLDCNKSEALEALSKLKASRLLTGYRGTANSDLTAIAETALKLADFMAAHPEITEIELNPLVVYPEGQGVCVLDALIKV